MAGNLAPALSRQWFDDNGNPLAGGLIYSYQAGTTTPQATYTDSGLGTPHANPVVLDANGRKPGGIWLDQGLSYKFVVKTSGGVTITTEDNIIGQLTANSVSTSSLQDGSVTTAKLAALAVTSAKLASDASVDANRAVQTDHIRDGVVTEKKLAVTPNPEVNGFRLTLTSALPVTTSDVTGATTIYCTPYKSTKIALYDGSVWNTRTSAEFSLALGTLVSGRPYDVFCYDNSGVPTLEFLVWTNDTTRATALVLQDGVYVKSGATTRRYLGTFHTDSTTTTKDTKQFRYLFNYYNQARRPLLRRETNASWVYNSTTLRQSNGSTSNQVEVMNGLDVNIVDLLALTINGGGGTGEFYGCIGLDSTSAAASDSIMAGGNFSNSTHHAVARFSGHVGVGRHYLTWLEAGTNGATSTFYGQYSGLAGNTQYAGLSGQCVQ
jgi:hypothetical protein